MNKRAQSKFLKQIISKWGDRESHHIEYKLCESGLSKDIWETVSAFSNEGDGLILLGYREVKDKHIATGVKNPS